MIWYEVLGIPHNVTQAEAKSAYKKLAMKYHPDINPNGESMMKAINNAWDDAELHFSGGGVGFYYRAAHADGDQEWWNEYYARQARQRQQAEDFAREYARQEEERREHNRKKKEEYAKRKAEKAKKSEAEREEEARVKREEYIQQCTRAYQRKQAAKKAK